MKIINLFILALLFASCNSIVQTAKEEIFATPEKSGGVNYAYPSQDIIPQTPAPDGYQPFYIAHFGRHGSRYLIGDNEYKQFLDLFHEADSCKALTPLGEDVYKRLDVIWQEAEGNGGELSPLGIRQQKQIAERMYDQYPEVFNGEPQMTAVSTTVGRCIRSMEFLCQRLMELKPSLSIPQDADPRHMDYLNYHTKEAVAFRYNPEGWKVDFEHFKKEHVHPERLIESLFSDTHFLNGKMTEDEFIWGMFNIAGNLQNMETATSLYDVFEKEELFDLWQCKNYSLYVQYANATENGGIMMENAKPLLSDMIESARQIIKTKGNGVSIRIGHDGNIIPLAMLMHLQECYNSVSEPSEFYKAWSNFKVAPMAANIQMVFFRKKDSDDILVKFLHNEKEIRVPPVESNLLPYYHWNDVLKYYDSLIRD